MAGRGIPTRLRVATELMTWRGRSPLPYHDAALQARRDSSLRCAQLGMTSVLRAFLPGPRTPDPGPRTPDPGPRTPDPGERYS